MEKKLINLENRLIKWVGNFIAVAINRFKIYFFIIFFLLIVVFSKLPFFNLLFNREMDYTLILLISILLFKLSAKTIFFLLLFLLFLILFVSLLNILSVEGLSSIAFITFVFMVVKLIIDYKE